MPGKPVDVVPKYSTGKAGDYLWRNKAVSTAKIFVDTTLTHGQIRGLREETVQETLASLKANPPPGPVSNVWLLPRSEDERVSLVPGDRVLEGPPEH